MKSKKWIHLVLLICCAAVLPPLPTPKKRATKLQSPKAAELTASVGKPMVIVHPPRTNTIAFKYPSNMTNYWWDLQTSTNMKTWTTISSNMLGPSSTSSDIWVYKSNGLSRMMFYRMHGVHK